MPGVFVNGTNLYYEAYGEGEPLVLIMGMGSNMEGWRSQLKSYSREFNVIAYDHRGTGRSDKPDELYSIRLFAEDAIGLLDALGIERAHFYGVSMGGLIAQQLGLDYPQRVRTLVLGCTTSGGRHAVPMSPEASESLRQMGELPPEEAMIQGLPFSFSKKFIDANYDQLLERGRCSMKFPTPPETAARHYYAAMHFNVFDRLPELTMPVLVITGREDRIVPSRNSEILAERIPRAELVLLDGAGHGYVLEEEGLADAAVLEFLRQSRVG